MESSVLSQQSEPTPPTSIEDAKAQLAQIKLKKQELSLQKKQIVEQQRQVKASYTDATRDRATIGKGIGAAISPNHGKIARKAVSVKNSYDRKGMAEELEPLEMQRQEVEAAIQQLDLEKLRLDAWIAEQKAK
jgi:hypothetical protein